MKNILLTTKIIILLAFLFTPSVFAEVYLLTEHDGVDHSMLVVLNENGDLTGFMSKQPGSGVFLGSLYDTASYDKQTGILYVDKGGGKILEINLKEGNAKQEISSIQLTVSPEMEAKIVKEIAKDKSTHNALESWQISNCAVTIEQILEKSGYLEKSIWSDVSYSVPLYGQYKVAFAPSILEGRVEMQERLLASTQRFESEKNDLQDQNEDNVSNSEKEPDGDNVVSNDNNDGDNANKTPSGDSVVNGGEQQTGYGNSNNTLSGDDVSSGTTDTPIDWEHNSDDDTPAIGNVLEKIKENSPIVGPNIPHYRVLWIFAGENWADAIKAAGKGIGDLISNIKEGNISISSISDSISDEMGFKDMKAALESIGD